MGIAGQMEITPNIFKISPAKITTRHTGAIQRIMTSNSFFLRKEPEASTSSETTLVPTTCPTRIQVRNATTGMRMELEIKSKKSRKAMPSTVTAESGPYPRQDSVPNARIPTVTASTETFRFQ